MRLFLNCIPDCQEFCLFERLNLPNQSGMNNCSRPLSETAVMNFLRAPTKTEDSIRLQSCLFLNDPCPNLYMRITLLQSGIHPDIAHLRTSVTVPMASLLHHDKGLLVDAVATIGAVLAGPFAADLRPACGGDLGPGDLSTVVLVAAAVVAAVARLLLGAAVEGGTEESSAADEEGAEGRQVGGHDGHGDFDLGPDSPTNGGPCIEDVMLV